MTPEEIAKQAAEEMKKAFEEFKRTNDERLKTIESKGSAPADFETKLAKINEALDTAEKKHQKAVEDLEAKLNRAQLGAAGQPKKEDAAERKSAFVNGFLRKGTERMSEAEKKSLVLSDDTASGYLSPVEYVREIIKDVVLFSPMRGLVRVRATSSRSMAFPKRTRTAAAKWVGETDARSETQNPLYGLEEVPAHEMTAEAYVSNQDLEDAAFDLEAELRLEFAEQFAVTEGLAIISGNGIAKPFGILDASQGIATVKSGTATTIADANGVADGLIDMVHALPSAYAARAQLILNRKTLGSVRKMKDAQKRYIWEPSPAPGLPSMILGSGYVECPDMPDEAANTTPIGFGDWQRCYILGDRIAMSVVRDPFTQATNGMTRFVARRRIAGKVVLANAARLLKCAA